MKMKLVILCLGVCMSLSVWTKEHTIKSPDGKMVVTLSDEQGKPAYTVSYNNEVFIMNSPLGLNTNIGNFTQGMTMQENVVVNEIHDAYTLKTIKQSHVNYHAHEMVCTFENQGKKILRSYQAPG